MLAEEPRRRARGGERSPSQKACGRLAGKEFNLGSQAQEKVDLSGYATYERALDLIADPRVEIVDICMPTRCTRR